MNTSGKPIHTHTHTDSSSDIPIFTKLYEFYKETYQILSLFPKRDRYTLGQKIDNGILEIFELISKVNMVDKPQKLELLINGYSYRDGPSINAFSKYS